MAEGESFIILNSMFDIRYSFREHGKFIILKSPTAKAWAKHLRLKELMIGRAGAPGGSGPHQRKQEWNMRLTAIVGSFVIIGASLFPQISPPPNSGFVVHFDFISNVREGHDLVRIVARTGAKVINVVPSARIWENKLASQMLDGILDEISRNKLSFVFTRIKGSARSAGYDSRRQGVA
jgi:hypothetical protein